MNLLQPGEWSQFGWSQAGEMAGNTLWGAATGGVAEVIGPVVRGGQNFNPWRSPRTFGPKAMQKYAQDAITDTLGTEQSMVNTKGRGKCGCKK
jgi:hypothetical protein